MRASRYREAASSVPDKILAAVKLFPKQHCERGEAGEVAICLAKTFPLGDGPVGLLNRAKRFRPGKGTRQIIVGRVPLLLKVNDRTGDALKLRIGSPGERRPQGLNDRWWILGEAEARGFHPLVIESAAHQCDERPVCRLSSDQQLGTRLDKVMKQRVIGGRDGTAKICGTR